MYPLSCSGCNDEQISDSMRSLYPIFAIFCILFVLHLKADKTFENDNSEAWGKDKRRSGKGDKELSNSQAKVSHILT